MPHPGIEFIQTTVPISIDEIEDVWEALQKEFLLPDFWHLLEGKEAISEWVSDVNRARALDGKDPGVEFRNSTMPDDESVEAYCFVTGVSGRRIYVPNLAHGYRPSLYIDFKFRSLVCAARVLGLLPPGIDLMIGCVNDQHSSLPHWQTGDFIPDGIYVDRQALAPSQMEELFALTA